MTEQVRESLSALLDNEASELDVQRLINAKADEEMAQFCQRSALVKAVMTGGSTDYSSIDLSQSISQAIANEPEIESSNEWQDQDATAVSHGSTVNERWTDQSTGGVAAISNFFTGRNVGGMAIAASVAFAAVFGVRQLQTPVQTELPQIAQQQPAAIIEQQQNPVIAPTEVIATRSVNSESIARAISKQASNQTVPLNVVSGKQPQPTINSDQLDKYYQEHAEHSALRAGRGMMPFARIVNYKQPTTSSE